jgi:formamidopyrimidine-DNA glycosylase
MPELPEVEAARRLLEKALVGHRISSLKVHDRRAFGGASIGEFHHALQGAEVGGVGRRGKYLLMPLLKEDGQWWLIVHFGMTGWFFDHPAPHPVMSLEVEGGPSLWLEDGRKFAKVWLHGGRISEFEGIAKLGPEADLLTLEALRAALDSRRDVKTLLMDQERIAGLGNIYANEALWAARVHPIAAGVSLRGGRSARLLESIVSTVRRSVEFSARTLRLGWRPVETDAEFRESLKVYGREAEGCRNHPTSRIVRLEHGGRSSYYCPRCQRKPP